MEAEARLRKDLTEQPRQDVIERRSRSPTGFLDPRPQGLVPFAENERDPFLHLWPNRIKG